MLFSEQFQNEKMSWIGMNGTFYKRLSICSFIIIRRLELTVSSNVVKIEYWILRSYVLRMLESATIRERSFSFSSQAWSRSGFLKQNRKKKMCWVFFGAFIMVFICCVCVCIYLCEITLFPLVGSYCRANDLNFTIFHKPIDPT